VDRPTLIVHISRVVKNLGHVEVIANLHFCVLYTRLLFAQDRFSTTLNHPGIDQVEALADISRSALCCHGNETRAPIANPPNSAQLGDTPYHSPSYIRVRAVVRECGDG